MLEQRGADAIIAQGTEAGGHRATFSGVDIAMQPGYFRCYLRWWTPCAYRSSPPDGRTAAAAFMLGASAVQLGTAFMRCEEANMFDAHRAALAEADDSCTLVTDLISGRPARYMRNRLVDDLVASGLKPLPIPAQLSLTWPLGESGDRDWAVLLCGQSAALTKNTAAAEMVQRLAEETTARLRVFG